MLVCCYLLIIFFLGCSVFIAASPLSDAVKPCWEATGQLDTCIKNDLNLIIPSLANGWKWTELPGIDPLSLTSGFSPNYVDDNMSLELMLNDVVLSGLSATKVQAVKTKSIQEHKLEIMTKTPKIEVSGNYISEGILATLPLHSSGSFNITMVDINCAWIIYLKLIEKENEQYLKVENLVMDVMPSEIGIQASHILDGSNELGANLNVYLNENPFELYNLVKPNLMRYFSEFFLNLISAVLLTSPKRELLPDVFIDM